MNVKTKKMQELSQYAEMAYNILNNKDSSAEINYGRSKRIIEKLFRENINDDREVVVSRLTLIDSFYSTQINSKRLFGIDDITDKIVEISEGNDEILINKCRDFLKSSSSQDTIKELFEQNYGIHKTGLHAGKAPSLISKYLYYLTNYEFPIYDNLAFSSYKKLNAHFALSLPDLKENFDISYFDCFTHLNNISNIKNIEKLDNLLWLVGKITQGSLSIIIDKKNYLCVAERANVMKELSESKQLKKDSQKKIKALNADDIIRNYLIKHLGNLKDIIEDETLIKFIQFSLQLNN